MPRFLGRLIDIDQIQVVDLLQRMFTALLANIFVARSRLSR